MSMFFVSVVVPYIGMHRWTAWDNDRPICFFVECASQDEVVKKIEPYLPPQDPEVTRALLVQDHRSEYFDINVVELEPLDVSSSVFGLRLHGRVLLNHNSLDTPS